MAEDDQQIPKHRFDQESQKRKDAEQALKDLQKDHGTLESKIADLERKQAETDSDYKKLYEDEQKKTQRLQTKLSEQEGETKKAEGSLDTYKRRVAFTSAARGVVRAEALDDAFSMIPAEDWEGVDLEDEEKVKVLAQGIAEKKTYLADTPQGAGSGRGAGRPVALVGQQDGAKKPLPYGRFSKRRVN